MSVGHPGDRIGYQLMEWSGSGWVNSRSLPSPMDLVPAVSELDANRARYPEVTFCLVGLSIAVIDHATVEYNV